MSAILSDAGATLSRRIVERRLAEFVDRDAEMKQFKAVLKSNDKLVMVVHGGSGMGKTSLLLRMVHECALGGIRKAEVVWTDTSPHDYMAVLRKIRDDLGVEHFQAFTDLINFFTDAEYHPKLEVTLSVQGQIAVGAGMQVTQSAVGDVSGVVIRDNMFVVQRSDLAIPVEVRRDQLTTLFLKGLRAASEASLVVIFLDAIEKMSEITNKWLWERMLEALRSDMLPNVRFLLCGQKPPPDDRDWAMFIARAELQPLGVDDIAAYIGKRAPEVPELIRRELARMILGPTRGRPTEVAAAVDAYLAMPSSS